VCVEVVDIMRVNVDKVLERDQKLSELDNRAGERSTRSLSCSLLRDMIACVSLVIH